MQPCLCALLRWSFTLSFLLLVEASAGPPVSKNETKAGTKEKEIRKK